MTETFTLSGVHCESEIFKIVQSNDLVFLRIVEKFDTFSALFEDDSFSDGYPFIDDLKDLSRITQLTGYELKNLTSYPLG